MKCIVGCNQPQILDSPPTIGSLLTVKHSGYFKNGALRNPFYWRSKEFIEPFEGIGLNWTDILHHKELFDLLGNRLKYKSLDHFYKISLDDIKLFDGDVILNNYY